MADPISLVGLTAGLVSLGLQASGGIVKYLDTLECREEDIASVRQQNASLAQILLVVEEAISQIQPKHQASTAAVHASLDICKRQLNALNALVVKLAGPDQSTPRTGTPVARVKRHGTKLFYPFRRQKIEQLAARLCEANTALQLALQALSITTTHSVESTSYTISSDLVTLQSTVTEMSTPLQNLHAGLPAVQTRLDTIEALMRQLLADHTQQPSAEAAQYLCSNEITGRLVRKPDVLRKFCDTARVPNPSCSGLTFPVTRGREQFRNIVSSLTGGRFGCSCWPLTLRQRKDIVWGSLAVHFETSSHEHSPGCPFAGAIDKDRKQHLRVEYTGLRRLLNVAIQLSFAAKSGAGGWSISPNFAYHPTVDEHSAPAFRILECLRYATVMRAHEIPDQWMTTLATSAATKLVALFQSRKASPLAVDSRNRSLVHYMTQIICRTSSYTRNWEILLEVLNCLVAYGAPAHDYDLAGNTPLVAVTNHWPERCVVVADILLQSSKDIGPAALNLIPTPSGSSRPRRILNVDNLMKVMSRSSKVAEAYGCGPLTSAILAHDLGQVEHLLKRHPAVMNERNILGQTPLHVAVPKPLCLSLLVRAGSTGDGALLNERGPNGWCALEMALRLSGSQCRNGRRRQRCRGCRCVRSVTILLQADCAVPMLPRSVLSEASYLCKLRYIRHMKNRRERLKQLALANLSTAESRELGLLDQRVLDYFAPQVVRLLQQRGIDVPASLLVDIPNPSPQSTSAGSSTTPASGASSIGNTSVPRSVYEELNDVLDAKLFFRLGFRDTDILQHAHLYIPTDSLDVRGTLSPLPRRSAMQYMHWLAEHGADFISHKLRSFGSGRGWFAAHATFSKIGKSLTDWTNKAFPLRLPNTAVCSWIRELHAAVLRANMADACKCRCSLGGCTPLKYLYLGLRDFFSLPPNRDDVTGLGLICAKYLENFSAHYRARHHAEAIRYFTFQALGLPHTCACYESFNLFSEQSETPNGEDVDEIEDEHAHELEVFEELVCEFEGNVRTILQDTDKAIPGIVHFWKQTWVDRVCEILEYLEGGDLSDGEKQAAEDIGVVWDEPQEKRPVREQARKMEEEEGKGGKNPFRDDTLEYWIYKLEKIAPN